MCLKPTEAIPHNTAIAGSVFTQVLKDNPRRLAVLLTPPSNNVFNLSFSKALADTFYILNAGGTSMIVMYRDQLGDIVTRQWFALSAGDDTITLTELVELPEE